jgi:hypothetical protein
MRAFLDRVCYSVILSLFLLSNCDSKDSAERRQSNPDSVVGIKLEPRGNLPKMEILILTNPPVRPELVVKPMSQSISDALESCSSIINAGGLSSGLLSFDFIFTEGKLKLKESTGQGDELQTCLRKFLNGAVVQIAGLQEKTEVNIRMRKQPAQPPESPKASE